MYAGFIYLPEVLVLCFGPSVASPIKLPHITNMGCFRVHIAYLCMAVTSISIFDGCRAFYGIIMIYIVHPVLMHLGVSSFLLLFCYYNAAVNIFCSFLCLCLKVLLWGRFPEMCCVENRGYAFKILIENVYNDSPAFHCCPCVLPATFVSTGWGWMVLGSICRWI